jgi:uncharacterized protein (DUF2267 family)
VLEDVAVLPAQALAGWLVRERKDVAADRNVVVVVLEISRDRLFGEHAAEFAGQLLDRRVEQWRIKKLISKSMAGPVSKACSKSKH